MQQANFLSDMALELTNSGYWHVDYSDPDYYYQSELAARIVGEEIKPDGRYHLQDEWFSRLDRGGPRGRQQTAERYQGAIEGRYPHYDAIYAYRRPSDGQIVWLHASGWVVRGEDGKARYMYGVYQDITASRLMEQEIVAARQKAEEATRAKSDFLANMSHEIRTPMNAVIGMTHLALQTELTPKQRDYLRKIDGSAKALLRIINDILDFSKIEAGRLDIESVEFDLEEVLDNLASLVTVKAEEKGLEVLFRTEPGVPLQLVGDPLRLGQVLLNLAGNAVKFTEEGEIVVSTRVVELTEDRAVLEFSVSDTGIGMTARAGRQALPAVLAGRHVDHPQVRRDRPGPLDLQAARRDDGGPDPGRERARQGERLPLHGDVRPHRQVEGPPLQPGRRPPRPARARRGRQRDLARDPDREPEVDDVRRRARDQRRGGPGGAGPGGRRGPPLRPRPDGLQDARHGRDRSGPAHQARGPARARSRPSSW